MVRIADPDLDANFRSPCQVSNALIKPLQSRNLQSCSGKRIIRTEADCSGLRSHSQSGVVCGSHDFVRCPVSRLWNWIEKRCRPSYQSVTAILETAQKSLRVLCSCICDQLNWSRRVWLKESNPLKRAWDRVISKVTFKQNVTKLPKRKSRSISSSCKSWSTAHPPPCPGLLFRCLSLSDRFLNYSWRWWTMGLVSSWGRWPELWTAVSRSGLRHGRDGSSYWQLPSKGWQLISVFPCSIRGMIG